MPIPLPISDLWEADITALEFKATVLFVTHYRAVGAFLAKTTV